MLLDLTTETANTLHNTGRELTAQCLSKHLEELYIGNGSHAYMEKADAKQMLSDADYKNACTHPDNKNPLYVYLDSTTLDRLLTEHHFIIAEDDE